MDLPLKSNIDKFRVYHFMLDLSCDFSSKTFTGNAVYFLTPTFQETLSDSFELNIPLILDCCNIDVHYVHLIKDSDNAEGKTYDFEHQKAIDNLQDEKFKFRQFHNLGLYNNTVQKLHWKIDEWCIVITKPSTLGDKYSSLCIVVNYSTRPSGQSIKWTFDQDKNPCVYTPGHWINNRSLFPNQDVPGAVATWQARITVEKDFTVILSGDEPCSCERTSDRLVYSGYSSKLLPSCTFAIAIGQWASVNLCSCQPILDDSAYQELKHNPSCLQDRLIPCHLFGPQSLISSAARELSSYLPKCLSAACELLGPYPFSRVDILVVATSFASLALANPNVIFISQSLLPGDGSNCIRLAHEICHSWFGLMIGPANWTEEWLTEGFATYLEDIIHARVRGWSGEYLKDFSELRATLRHRTLIAEISTSPQELQILEPKIEKTRCGSGCDKVIKNGMNPDKAFTQVHYLKGYFLLRHLSNLVGSMDFNIFFKQCAQNCPALITSRHAFEILFQCFPSLHSEYGLIIADLCHQWLELPGLPQTMSTFTPQPNNLLINEARYEYDRWISLAQTVKKRKFDKQPLNPSIFSRQLIPDQIVLILEWLLESDGFIKGLFPHLNMVYNIHNQNADVRHRWCELIIKYRYLRYCDDIRQFLTHDQAMGVYLFGELMISEDRTLLKLARDIFNDIKCDMEEGNLITVKSMLYPDTRTL